jgi:hypothetical protein
MMARPLLLLLLLRMTPFGSGRDETRGNFTTVLLTSPDTFQCAIKEERNGEKKTGTFKIIKMV